MAHSQTGGQLVGIIGFFDEPHALIKATEKTRDAKFKHFDTYTPYPVHGLEAAQGLKRSPLPYVTFMAGLTGCMLGFLFQYWTSAIDWPINVGGKPLNSWPAFVPVMFEVTVLFAGLSTVGAMLAFCGLPNLRRKAFDKSITKDRFAIVIEAAPRERDFDESLVAEFLKRTGAKEVRGVYAEGWF